MYKYLHKRIINVLIVGLFTLMCVDAEAHYIVVSGRFLYHSLLCEESLKGVQNPDTNPAAIVCNATGQQIEILCENPQNHNVTPGNAGTRTFSATTRLDQSHITGKGKATVQVLVNDDELLKPENCVNPNWHPLAALVRTALINMTTYECLTDDCSQLGQQPYSTIIWQCALPPQYSFDDYPNNMPVSGITEYSCTTLSNTHLR